MIREVDFRVKVLRNGASFTSLRWNTDEPPKVEYKDSGDIKGSFSGQFLPDERVNWLQDELQPCIILNGEETPLGIFRPTTLETIADNGQPTISIEAYDRAWLVQTGKTEDILHLSAGALYLDVIKRLLSERGVNNVLASPSAAVLPADREDWQIGTDYLSIINTLLGEIGFNELWFDAAGWAHLEAYTEPSAAAIRRRYSTRQGMQLLGMANAFTETTDIFDAPNVFIAICDNPDRSGTMIAKAENESFGPKSILQRKMRIPTVERVDQIADQASLQIYANRLRDESLQATKTVTFSVPAEPHHAVGDIISVEHPDIGGIYRETGWSLTMEAGELMKITAKKAVIL